MKVLSLIVGILIIIAFAIHADTTKKEERKLEKATFAAGCFWGVEETFREVNGVVATQVGYTGGKTADPSYKDVCSDTTGHAEAVEVEYDPSMVSYQQLLNIFWENHDPTQVDRQGPDYGSQYRSVIFYHTPEQKQIAEASKDSLGMSGKFKRPIATQILEAPTFYRAEDYHQQYLAKRGLGSCHIKP
jgi:peptide-methionine (S)-S-oxide reductase